MSKLTPEREQFLRSYFSGNDPDSKKVSELFDEIDSLRHYAKSFNRNFAFMKQELEECEAKNRSLESQLMFAKKDLDTPSGKFDPYYGVTVSESGTIHSDSCDVDPETLTWKKSIEKYGTAKICFECLTSIDSKRRRT